MIKGRIYTRTLPFWTVRLDCGSKHVSEIIEYFGTESEAIEWVEERFSNYKVVISEEFLKVEVKF